MTAHLAAAGRRSGDAAHSNRMQITASTGATVTIEARLGGRVVTLTDDNETSSQ